MNGVEDKNTQIHHGNNAKRFRETRGIKQDVIAMELGITQQAVSLLEKRQELDDTTIAVYARVVGIDDFFIRNMVDESLSDGSTYLYDHSSQVKSAQVATQILNFNPLDKIMEICADKDRIYEQLLAEKDKVSNFLEKALEKLSK